MDARLRGFDCDSVIDGVRDFVGAADLEMVADGDCVFDSAGDGVPVAELVVERLERDVVVSINDTAPLPLCARVADVVIDTAVRVTAALKLTLREDDSL